MKTIDDYLDKASDKDWKFGLDLALEDMDTFGEWLSGHTGGRETDNANVQRFCMRAVRGDVINKGDFDVKDLLWVVFCEAPELSRMAIMLIRELYLDDASDYVAEHVAKLHGWEG